MFCSSASVGKTQKLQQVHKLHNRSAEGHERRTESDRVRFIQKTGKNDEPSLLIFVAVMFILFFLVINIRDVLYAAKSFAAASYISRHDTDMLLVTPNGFYKSIALRLFTRYPLDADMARYTLDGKERTAMIRNMLRLDKGSRQLLVFRGVDNGKVYAVPAIYMKELARQAKSAVDEQS